MIVPKFLKIIILLGLIVLIVVAGFFIIQNLKNTENKKFNLEQKAGEESAAPKPWIEVISSQTTKKDSETGESLMELKTGDELEQGETIETNKSGLAIIHFPDGSVARLEENSSLIIEQSSFDEKSETLKVRIKLKLGRVWSRVIQLVTADSFWEVKTSNVVATVRGTAFGTEHSEKKSLIIVMQGKVEAEAFDVETNKKIEGTKTILEKDKTIEIKKEKIKELKANPTELVVKKISQEVLTEKWIERNKEADSRFNEKIKKLEEKRLERKEIKEELKKEFYDKIKERQEQRQEIIKPEAEPEIEPKIEPIEPKKDQLKIEQSIEIRPKNLEIIMPQMSAVLVLIEDDILNLKAILTMTDGSKKEVTQECQWNVLGNIGIMKAPGVFAAKLDSSISELGKAPGQIICVWTDSKTNEAFLGSSPIINIKAKIEINFETQG
jgi:hypothetical protein